MAVLNDRKIKEYITNGKIIINPSPQPIQIQPSSVDLTLDSIYLAFKTTSIGIIDPKLKQEYTECRSFTEESPLILHPHELILGQTRELVKIPNDLLARVEGRSSFGRLGLAIHITAGFIDPGFEGNITLEIVNLGNLPVMLYPNQRVCQIVFEELVEPCEVPYGVGDRNKYQNQKSPTPSQMHNDKYINTSS